MVVAAPVRRWDFIRSRVTVIRGSLPRYSWGGAAPRPQQCYYHGQNGTLTVCRGYICLVLFKEEEGIYIRPTREWQGCGPVPQGSETRRGCTCLDTAALSPPVGLRLVDVAVILVVEPVCNIQHDLRYRGYCSIFTRGEGSRRLHNHGEGPYGLLMLSHLRHIYKSFVWTFV